MTLSKEKLLFLEDEYNDQKIGSFGWVRCMNVYAQRGGLGTVHPFEQGFTHLARASS